MPQAQQSVRCQHRVRAEGQHRVRAEGQQRVRARAEQRVKSEATSTRSRLRKQHLHQCKRTWSF
eukprot:1760411-Rhodomonas_salina.1